MLSETKKKIRKQIENYFRGVAAEENNKNKTTTLDQLIDKTNKKKMLLVAPESLGDLLNITALLKSFYEQNLDCDIYFATKPEYFEIFDNNPYIYKLIPYIQSMDSEVLMTGQGEQKGFFDKYCHLTVRTQRFLSYLTADKIALDLIT